LPILTALASHTEEIQAHRKHIWQMSNLDGLGRTVMRSPALALAVVLMIAPPGAEAADLVVWWFKGSTSRRMRRSGRSSPPLSRRPVRRSSCAVIP
jgi:hypothetical protein